MGEYKFKGKVDKENIYIVKRSKLDNRFDSVYYQTDIDYSKCIKLSKIAYVSGGKRLPKGYDYSNSVTKFRYLRIGNVSWSGALDYNNFKYISQELFEKLQRYEIKNQELLMAIVGATIGKCALIDTTSDDKIILTENCAKIKLKTENVLPEYLLIILQMNFIQRQIQLNFIQTTLPKLGLDRVLALYIPKPPSLKIQKEIVLKYQKAYNSKYKKEEEAKNLLDSIDIYLLNELNITLPKNDNSFENRVFTINFSEITGNRFESEYYSKYNRSLTNVVQNSSFSKIKLIDCLKEVKKGIEPGSNEYTKKGLPFIRVSDITKFGIDYINCDKKVSRDFYENHKEYYNPELNEILFSKDGTLGICYLVNRKEEYIVSSAFLRLIAKDSINSNFLTFLLSSSVYKDLAERNSIGTVIKHLNINKFLNLNIPLPPLEKQNEIANHIIEIRVKAKQLKKEGKTGLENAKQEIEKLIFVTA